MHISQQVTVANRAERRSVQPASCGIQLCTQSWEEFAEEEKAEQRRKVLAGGRNPGFKVSLLSSLSLFRTLTDSFLPFGVVAMLHREGKSRNAPETSSGRALSICKT